jgi:hypothetical protein
MDLDHPSSRRDKHCESGAVLDNLLATKPLFLHLPPEVAAQHQLTIPNMRNYEEDAVRPCGTQLSCDRRGRPAAVACVM